MIEKNFEDKNHDKDQPNPEVNNVKQNNNDDFSDAKFKTDESVKPEDIESLKLKFINGDIEAYRHIYELAEKGNEEANKVLDDPFVKWRLCMYLLDTNTGENNQ